MSFNTHTGRFPGKPMNAAALRIEGAPLIQRAAQRGPAKVIALKVGATSRQAFAWRQGEHEPHWPAFLMLAKNDPELRAWVLHQLDVSEDPQAMLAMVANHIARRG